MENHAKASYGKNMALLALRSPEKPVVNQLCPTYKITDMAFKKKPMYGPFVVKI